MTPLFVDSAYVIALINERDRYHVQAKRLARLYRDRALIISEGVLLEIGNALAGRFRLKAAQVIEQMLGSSQVEVVYTSPRLLTLAIALYKQMDDKQWGLVDCISFVKMCIRDRPITLSAARPDDTPVYHLYVIRSAARGALAAYLNARGIGTGVHYPVAVHCQPAYAHLGYSPGRLPVTEAAAAEVLSLPMYPDLTEGAVDEVAGVIREYFDSD